ncbi:protealysin inhibitor emfourin [Bordetella genomosp. 9]|uniref:Uncharacterized protein n=1 Tax=Bordetella genomosp. 9 TaxID=1416803 RepID=A0A1W6Z1Z6_9BORD|nr:protealysin inhibitor emfourin [Bordetella genomosp. 9]ARP87385.1 hypothetical protein CAL13_15085 [Bordetella genomosp. 9]ARP91367.1 hypothetical protein CAL14_14610 [Bordetella genomosp. 9]
MKPFPPWDAVIAVHLKRQGGVAAIPALSRPRTISLRDCSDDVRGRLCTALADAAAQAGGACGTGDQRYFTVEIDIDGESEALRFDVPESAAPEPLVRLWREGKT